MIREGSIQIPFNYAAGRTASHFLIGLRDEKAIHASRCHDCSKVLCPPRSFCPYCNGTKMVFVEVGPEGTIISRTEIPGRGVYGVIQLDGADTGMLHRLDGAPSQYAKGARVRARFAEHRVGSILDIEGFEYLGDNGQ